jgi:hypothetical protein
MNTNWNSRTIFMDVREVSVAVADGAAARPNQPGGSRLFFRAGTHPAHEARLDGVEHKKTAEWNKPASSKV